jgi:hypothetical protein
MVGKQHYNCGDINISLKRGYGLMIDKNIIITSSHIMGNANSATVLYKGQKHHYYAVACNTKKDISVLSNTEYDNNIPDIILYIRDYNETDNIASRKVKIKKKEYVMENNGGELVINGKFKQGDSGYSLCIDDMIFMLNKITNTTAYIDNLCVDYD